MTTIAPIRVPFSVVVDCGFEAVCFSRNISKTGVYFEAPRSAESQKIEQGSKVTLLVSPFGSMPSAQIQCEVIRLEEINLADGTPGLGFGVQFVGLNRDQAETLARYIKLYLAKNAPHDLAEQGKTFFLQIENNTLPKEGWAVEIRKWVQDQDAKAVERMRIAATKPSAAPLDAVIGIALLSELGIEAVIHLHAEGNAVEKRTVLDRIRVQVSTVERELQMIGEYAGGLGHGEKKEISDQLQRIFDAVKRAGDRLVPVSFQQEPLSSGPRSRFLSAFRDVGLYDSFAKTKAFASDISQERRELLNLILADWHKEVREHPALPDRADRLLKQCRAYSLKMSFEGRDLFMLGPVSQNASSILPAFREALTEATKLQKDIAQLIGSTAKSGREQTLCLERAAKYLGTACAEFESFLSSLPVNQQTAKKFYSKSFFKIFASEGTSASSIVRKRRKEASPVALYSLVAFVVLYLVVSNFGFVQGFFIAHRGLGMGKELGVLGYSVSDTTWIGKVDMFEWERIPVQERSNNANVLVAELMKRGFEAVEIRSTTGVLLGITLFSRETGQWKWTEPNIPKD